MKLRHICLAALSLTALTGCGKWAKAKKQDIVAIPAPAFPKIEDNVFALKDGKTSVSYKSTMLILNPTGNPTVLADLIRASELTRVKAAETRAFVGDEKVFDARYGGTGTLPVEIKNKQAALLNFLKEAQARAVPIPLADRQKAAAEWFPVESAKLNLSAEENQLLQTVFNNYCDAKIVEFAAHPLFANMSANGGYAERPSPNQLCESYYASKGYFQGESCKQGDYFSCMWTEGVLKSGTLLAQNGINLNDVLTPIFSDKTKTETFRKILMADEKVTAEHLKTPSTLVKEGIYKKKLYFYTALISGKPSIGPETTCINLLQDPSFSFICGMFTRTWKENTPQSFLTEVELSLKLLKVKDSPEMKTISDSVKFFGQRPTIGTPQSSNSDFYFHSLIAPNILTQPTGESIGLTQEAISNINNAFLDKVFSLNPEDNLIKIQRETELNALQKELVFHRSERDRLSNEAGDALQAGIRAANAGDIATGFLSYRLIVTHSGDIMRAAMTFEGFPTQFFEGCYDKVKLVSIDCPAVLGVKDTLRKATLNLNPAKGRIEFTLPMDEPEAVGFGYNPKNEASPDYFMNLKPEQIIGTELRFELYPNRLEKALDILTGKALFNKDGKALFEAGLSMWEE